MAENLQTDCKGNKSKYSYYWISFHQNERYGINKKYRTNSWFEQNKKSSQLSALVYLKVDSSYSMAVANNLSSFIEVKDIYMTTEEYNMAPKLSMDSVEQLDLAYKSMSSTLIGDVLFYDSEIY